MVSILSYQLGNHNPMSTLFMHTLTTKYVQASIQNDVSKRLVEVGRGRGSVLPKPAERVLLIRPWRLLLLSPQIKVGMVSYKLIYNTRNSALKSKILNSCLSQLNHKCKCKHNKTMLYSKKTQNSM